jgi:cobalt-zinc-cadmium efflux system outer membrane protein
MSRLFAAALAAASLATMARAQTPPLAAPAGLLSLDQAIALAGGASPAVEAATAGIRATTAARTVAGLRPNPAIQVETENVGGSGPYRGFRSAETTAGAALPVELGGKRSARVAVANARVSRAEIGAIIARADLELAVTQAYVDVLAADRRLNVAADQLAIAEEALRVATDRVDVGATSPIDQQRAQVRAINARTARDQAQRTLEVAQGNLAKLIGQPRLGPLDTAWFDRVGGAGPAVRARAEGTLALAAATADLATADAQVRLARAQRIPDLTVSAGARRFSGTNDTAAVLGVSVTVPLFNNGSAAVAQARAERLQAEAQRRLALVQAEREIAAAEAEVANAAANAKAAGGPALAAAQEAARIARVGYGQGKFGQLELLEAERTLAETRAAAIDALQSYHNAQARLRRLTRPAAVASPIGEN